jgi:peptide methionine sulfoxide reductase MsrB
LVAASGVLLETRRECGLTARATGRRAQREVEEDWQRQLTPLQFRVLRQRQTEDAGTGEHTSTAAAGTYSCAGCGLQLYDSKHKFAPEASVHGWPAFFDNIEGEPRRSPRTHTTRFPRSDTTVGRALFRSLEVQLSGWTTCV